MDKYLLKILSLSKSFSQPDKSKLTILDKLSLNVKENTIVAITGASGSGKSTLLHLIGGLDTPDSGEITYNSEQIIKFNTRRMSQYRNKEIGFVYQFHYLLPELTMSKPSYDSFNSRTTGDLMVKVIICEKESFPVFK